MENERRPGSNPYNNGRAAGSGRSTGGRTTGGSGQTQRTAGNGQRQRAAANGQNRSSQTQRRADNGQNQRSAGNDQTRRTAAGGQRQRPAGSGQTQSGQRQRAAGSGQTRRPAGNGQSRSGYSSRQQQLRAQRRRRYNIRRYSILTGLALFVIAVVVVVALLISALVRHFSGSDTAASAASVSAVETTGSAETAVSESPTPSAEPAQTVTIMAVGDNLIHNTVYEYAQQDDGSYDFTDIYSYVKDDIESADIACIQQETIFIADPDEYSNYPCFGTPTEMADSLTAVGFDVVCHASNHTLDKATQGIMDTLEKWKEHPEVTVLGIHDTEEDYDTIRIVEKNGIKIAMLDYTYGLNGFVPEEDYYVDLLDEDHKEHIQAQVEAAVSASDIVVVFMHDGTEDQLTPDDDQLSWAQFFADEGVGLIIGTHPHVIEPTDVLTGVNGNKMPVFYSLGNFVSSQADTMNLVGAIANATITKDATGTYVSDYSVEPVCTLISNEGKYGNGYAFHVYHLEDYTEELAAKHIRDACSPDDFWSVWNSVFDGDPAWNGTASSAAADTAETTAATDTTDTADAAATDTTTDAATTDTTAADTTGATAAAAVTPIAGNIAAAVTAVRRTVLAKAA